jgi:Arc-like DNA binding domain
VILAGETKPYRFLLRMPADLGGRLREAAGRSERSLNRELVARLEASLEQEARPTGRWGMRGLRSPDDNSRRGERMTRRRRQALGVVVAAVLAASALIAAITLSGTPAAAPAGGAFSEAFSKHIADLRAAPHSTLPGAPSSWEEEQDRARAYPAASVDYSWIQGARADWASTKGRPFASGKGRKGTWVSVGPSTALYPLSEFRTRELYVAGKYEAGGRMTAVAIAPTCKPGNCRLWVAAAGGGVWKTDNALAGTPRWEFMSGSFELNAIGSITLDPNDSSGNTVWVGTGEANAAGSAAAGVGIYKSSDGGRTWTKLGAAEFGGRAVGSIAIHPTNPSIVYAASTRAVRGISATTGGANSTPIGAANWGLYKSTDGGATWTYIHNGAATTAGCTQDISGAQPCSPRGVRRVAIDPNNANVLYAGSYARGVWRSLDAGANWTQIFAPIENGPATGNTERPEFAVADTGSTTRMYLQIGASGAIDSTFHVGEDVAGAATFTQKSSPDPAVPGWGSQGLCGNPAAGIGQCWYDQIVYSPPGQPNMVYVGGVYVYGEQTANHRGVVLSEDGGNSWYDMTEDTTDPVHPNQLHPDQHGLVTNPSNPYQFFEVGDGGLVRSSGILVDGSAQCATRGLNAVQLARCQQMLSKVPSRLDGINKGLQTLQFFTLSASPHKPGLLQGGTQDNGTWQTDGNPNTWLNTNISDGGHNGFDVAIPEFRFSMFFFPQVFVNYSHGADSDWLWVSDTFFTNGEQFIFYPANISDPVVSKTMYHGQNSVWRTKTAGQGDMTLEEFRETCNLWTGDFSDFCGDWERVGPTNLTHTAGTRANGQISMIERAEGDTGTLWAGTTTGRLFVTKNADVEPASAGVFDRVDTDSPISPGRFVSGIEVDQTNPNRAFVTYSGYSAATPSTPGHVFEVVYDGATGTATWTRIDGEGTAGGLPDTPVTDAAYDSVTGDLYTSNDFGVSRLAAGSSTWTEAAGGLPNVMVPSLTIEPGKRILYAATHGFAAFRLNLPK